jgi:branched-chain amino acid aminotransferase
MTHPIAWLNGRLLPESEAVLPALDRAILYGDSLFETIPIRNGRPFQWEAHLDRLDAGVALTGIVSGVSHAQWTEALQALLAANHALHGAVRLTVTRGVGRRGYSPRGAHSPNRLLTWHPTEPVTRPHPGWHLRTSRFRLAVGDPLAYAKHGSRLLQVVARAEAEAAGADEALLLDNNGYLAEATSGNLFWLDADAVHTPPPDAPALPGITAACLRPLLVARGLNLRETRAPIDALRQSRGAFLTLSTLGMVPVLSLDGQPLPVPTLISQLAEDLLRWMDQDPPFPKNAG